MHLQLQLSVHLITSHIHNEFIDISIDHSEEHTAVHLTDVKLWQAARGLDGIEWVFSMPVDM